MKRDRRRFITAFIAIIIALIMLLSVLAPLFTQAAEADISEALTEEAAEEGGTYVRSSSHILDHVKICGVSVSGLTREEALEKISAAFGDVSGHVLTVKAGEVSKAISFADLGFSYDAESAVDQALSLGQRGNMLVRYKERKTVEVEGREIELEGRVIPEALRSFLGQTAAAVNVPVVNRSIMLDDQGEPYVTDGSDGMVVDTDAAYETILQILSRKFAEGNLTVEMETHTILRGGDVEQLSRVKDVLGRGTTSFAGSSESRCANIRNLVRLVNGTVIMPGESFSTLEKAVPFTAENGYHLAYSMYDGSLVDTYGGGICQVSTTLYQAVLQAELPVDSRYEHSMLVDYVHPSFDAAISEEGGKDLVFRNDSNTPIVISGYVDGTDVSFMLYGEERRPADRQIRYYNEIKNRVDPILTFVYDDSLDAGLIANSGTPHTGVEASLWKEITQNGETSREWVNSSSYAVSHNIMNIGVKGMDEDTRARLEEAAQAKDLNIIREVLVESPYPFHEMSFDEWTSYQKEQEEE